MQYLENPGKYAVTVKAVQFGESSQKGTPFIELTHETDDGFGIKSQHYLSEKAFDRTVDMLRKCFGFDDNFDTIEGQVVDRRCSIECEIETYEKKSGGTGEALRVKWVNPENSGPKPIANQSEFLKSLSQKAARIARPADLPAPKPAVEKGEEPF